VVFQHLLQLAFIALPAMPQSRRHRSGLRLSPSTLSNLTMVTGALDLSFSVATAPYAVGFNGRFLCFSPNSGTFYCYQIVSGTNVYYPEGTTFVCNGQQYLPIISELY